MKHNFILREILDFFPHEDLIKVQFLCTKSLFNEMRSCSFIIEKETFLGA